MASTSLLRMLSVLFSLCFAADRDVDEWNLLSTGPWGAREGLMGTFYSGYIWMSGGRYSPPSPQNISQSIFYNDVWRMPAKCVSNPSTCEWQLVSNSSEWQPRAYHIMFNHSVDNVSYMYIIAGQNLSTFYNDVWRSTDGVQWQQVLPNDFNGSNPAQFHVRAGLAAVSNPGDAMMYVSSGCFDEFPNRQELNDVWRSRDGSQWQLVVQNRADSVMHVRSGPRVQIYGEFLYIVAGEHGFSETTQLRDVWKLDLSAIDSHNISENAWQLVVAHAPFVNRSGHGFVIDTHGSFWVIAGYLDLHDLWTSRDLGVSWSRVDRHVFNCAFDELHCGRYDFWAQLDDQNNLFLYGGDSDWNTFGGEWNQTFQRNLDSYDMH